MLWSEWWAWEVNLFFAGLLCTGTDTNNVTIADATTGAGGEHASCVPLDAFPIVSQTMVICFMVHFGFGVQGGAHVGNMLGANEPTRARTASLVGVLREFEAHVPISCRF